MGRLTKSRKAILEAAMWDKFSFTGHLASADGLVPAEAWMSKGNIKRKVSPKDIDALYRADLFDLNWQGLGNWTGYLSMKGRAALKEPTHDEG